MGNIGGRGTHGGQPFNNVNIDGGTIDGTTIGGTSPGTGAFSTVNDLTLTKQSVGFTIAGGTTSKTLTVGADASVSGTNTGDQDLSSYATKVVPTVDGHSSGALSAANVSGTIVSNYGQGASDVALTLPAAAAGYSFIGIAGTAQAGNTWKFTADTNDKIYLDGVAGTDNQSVIVTPTVGNFITFFTFQTGAGAYDWIAVTGNGTWTAGA